MTSDKEQQIIVISKRDIAEELYGKPCEELDEEKRKKVHQEFIDRLMGRE